MFDHRTVSAPALSNHGPYILFNSFWCDMVLSGKFWVDNLCNPDGFIFHLHYKYHCISKILIPLILFTYTQPSDQTIHFLHFSLLHPLSCIRSLDRYRQYKTKKRRLRKFELFRESSRFFELFREILTADLSDQVCRIGRIRTHFLFWSTTYRIKTNHLPVLIIQFLEISVKPLRP